MPSATSSVRKTFDEARRLARVHVWREKALVYLTRGADELLVLEHTEGFPDAGVQVPAGGVEPGEDPGQPPGGSCLRRPVFGLPVPRCISILTSGPMRPHLLGSGTTTG